MRTQVEVDKFPIRLARPDEVEHLNEVERGSAQLYRTVGYDDVAESDPLELSRLSAMQSRDHLWVITDTGDVPVGFLAVEIIDDLVHIEEISVRAEYTGKGLGSKLIEMVSRWAHAQGYPALTLSTFRSVPWNAPFYSRRGFCILSEGDLTPGLRAVLAHEAADGLDITERVCMRRELH
ncbi:MAG: GNAT family N-acetyltransferase [Anaerolineales bacterium]|nr:GNAT family N-acetyltransferase [Anaerolineales bacterium]